MNEQTINKDIQSAIDQLNQWIATNGWAGWDPYDIKAKPRILKITEKSRINPLFRIWREIVFESFTHFPLFFRKLLHVQPRINAKAMALFASAYLNLYETTGRKDYLNRSLVCLDWLGNNRALHIAGSGWGYPFDWFSNELVPAGTPNGIVTTAAGHAFWKAYKLLGQEQYLKECINIAHFLAGLPKNEAIPGTICFSYTPLYINHVHNLNLFVAEFLIRVGKETNNQGWVDLGNRAADYTLACQDPAGFFDYNGPPEKPARFVDHYHTGFVIRMLHALWKHTGREDIRRSMERCYKHYMEHFFEDGQIPRLILQRKYRIDIHSCAEAVICLSELHDTFPGAGARAERVLNWTLEHLRSKKGYFYYGIHKSRFTGIPFKSKIPYIRWGQAWMLLALSTFLKKQVHA